MSRPGVSRRAVLLGSGASLLVGCARPPIVITTPTKSPTGSVREQLTEVAEAFAGTTRKLGMAVRDLRTGAEWDFQGDYASQSASIAKVMIVAMALRQARATGEPFTFEDYARASKAITVSDNDSADELWASSGERPAYDELAAELGLPETHSDPDNSFWSWTWTTPRDQRELVRQLVEGTKALHTEDRLYLLDLMSRVTSSQRWGVGSPTLQPGLSGRVKVEMKNGWVEFKSSDGLWAVNSIGHVSGEGRDYVAAMMCRVDSFEKGRQLLDAIGAELWTILGEGELVH